MTPRDLAAALEAFRPPGSAADRVAFEALARAFRTPCRKEEK